MNILEDIIDDYANQHFDEKELQAHTLYKGHYLDVFDQSNSSIEESTAIGLTSTLTITILVWILEKIAGKLLDDGYELTKEYFLEYLRKKQHLKFAKDDPKFNKEAFMEVSAKLESVLEERVEE